MSLASHHRLNPAAGASRSSYSLGLWLCWPIALLMLVNAVRAWVDPAGFASYLGLPLQTAGDAALVQIYALRAAFLGLFALALLWLRAVALLRVMVLVALVMPLGDAWLTWQAGAPGVTVGRHLAIALFLVVTGALLHRAVRQGRTTGTETGTDMA